MTSDTPVTARGLFLPGRTTDGHHQIEIACGTCHTPFAGVTDAACLACHGDELVAANDSHPRSKFTDPRNVALVTRLDARRCVTCHVEHRPAVTRAMGVTRQDDFCSICHGDIGDERPSHAGFAFTTCASSGCHNYHDNTSLYEDFLLARGGDPPLHPEPVVPYSRPSSDTTSLLTVAGHDAPAPVKPSAVLLDEWSGDAHARAGINCTGCHTAEGSAGASWVERPGLEQCATCHDAQRDGFLAGKHGMRVAAGLDPVTPANARVPMRASASGRALSCTTCHPAHAFDTRAAAADACLTCHDDGHSRAFWRSPHGRLWKTELDGAGAAGSGVSCATCHLPREGSGNTGLFTLVQHNQNLNLRPNEKMLRSVCLNCHGLSFSIDALADRELMTRNFTGRPSRHVESIDMAIGRHPASPRREATSQEGGTR